MMFFIKILLQRLKLTLLGLFEPLWFSPDARHKEMM